MSSGLATLLKIIGGAVIIAAIVLAITGQLDTVINGVFTWFKSTIGMTMIMPLTKNTLSAIAICLWG